MTSDGKFWLSFWAITAAMVVAISICVTVSIAKKNAAIERVVSAGADPIKAYCALSMGPSSGDAALCMAVALKGPAAAAY